MTNIGDIVEVDDVEYVAVAETALGGCNGCAADGSSASTGLCSKMPVCAGVYDRVPVIFVLAEKGTKTAAEVSAQATEVVALEAAERPTGRKDDSGKLDVTLFFDDLPNAIEAVTEVLQWAITKKQPVPYERGSWQGVEPFQPRYRAAQLRHMLNAAKAAKATGTLPEFTRDHETGLLELAHIATDAMFQLEMACRELQKLKAQAERETH